MTLRQTAFEAIGTRWSVQVWGDITDADWEAAQMAMGARIEAFDHAYSRFRDDSMVSQMSRKAGRYKLPSDALQLLQFYRKLYDATGGLVTPLIGQTMVDAGYDTTYSFTPKALSAPPDWDEALHFDRENVELSRPALLDVGAAGKGYLVDLIGQLLVKHNIRNFVINAGGDVLHQGPAGAIRVALENPQDTSQALGVVELANASLCASAGTRRQWGSYHHIINPVTLNSPREIVATWVIAKDAMTADGLATALFLVEPEQLGEFKFDYAVLGNNMNMRYSAGFSNALFKDAS